MARRLLEAFVLAAILTGCGDADDRSAAPAAPPPRHFAPVEAGDAAAPDKRGERPRHRTAMLSRDVALRARPRGRVLHRLDRHTEFGSTTVLGVVGRRGRWLKVLHPSLENDERGWIRANRRVELGGTDIDIRVDRSKLQGTLRRDGRAVMRFPVAVGRPGNETPLGRYAVTDKLDPSSPASPYGCCAVALTGHQTQLEPGWPGGDRLAIHGTPSPETVGHAVSLGCLRAYAHHLRKLMRKVPLGAPVVVKA